MLVLSFIRNSLFERGNNIHFDKKRSVIPDIIITASYNKMIDLSKKYKGILVVFLSKKNYKKLPNNVFIYDKLDIFKNSLIFNNIKRMAITLKKSCFNKIKLKLKKSRDIKDLSYAIKKLGFSLKRFSDIDTFNSQIRDKNLSILNDNKIYDNEQLKGFFINRDDFYYFFKYKLDSRSLFYNKAFDISMKFIKESNFFNKKKSYERSLRENEKFFATHVGEGFFIQDGFGNITFSNNILRKMLINYNIDFNYLKNIFLNNSNNIKIHRSFTVNFETQNPIEGKFYFELNYSPIKNGNKVVSFCAIMRDISLQKRLKEALQVSNSELERINKVLKTIQNATILGFSRLAEYKDKETAGHLDRIQNYVRALTKEIYLREIYIDYKTKKNYITEEYIDELSFSSILHDIGKMGIPDNILQKPTRLTSDEFVSMQSHTKIGGDTLKSLNDMVSEKTFLAIAKEVAYYHHEKWNGKGYPFGLREENIPLSARIVGLCDVYDALTTKRSYKEPYSHEKACEIIYNNSGYQFDPTIISVFSSVEEEFRHIRNTFSE